MNRKQNYLALTNYPEKWVYSRIFPASKIAKNLTGSLWNFTRDTK